MEPFPFDLNRAVEVGGLWLGPMLGPVAAALWAVAGPPLEAIYQSLVLASASSNFGQALGQAVGTLFLIMMVVLAVVVLLVSIIVILVLILGISFLVTVLGVMRRSAAPA